MAIAGAVLGMLQPTSGETRLPHPLDSYIDKYVHLTSVQQSQLASGQPVSRLLDADPSKEIVVFGAVWVNAPIESYLAAVKDIERLESGGGFRITRKISVTPRIEDFAELTIPEDDVTDLQSCRVGKCELKLSQASIERVRREVRWGTPSQRQDVNRLARSLALDYVTGYLEGGNARLAVYRDSDRPTFVANEFRTMIDQLPAMTEHLSEIRRYLLDFPTATLEGGESFLYWQEAQFGLKPTIRINHLVMAPMPGGAVIASKMLYATHYFWTALELRVLARDPSHGAGFWFVSVNRSRSDGLSGFVGRAIRGKVRSEAEKGMISALEATRSFIETRREGPR